MPPPRRISAVIPSYNRPDLVRWVLLSLAGQTRPVDEVIITDDGSRMDVAAGIADLLGELPFPVVWVQQADEGFRAAKCRNNGIREATGDYLVFGDQDIVVARTYIARLAAAARPREFLVGLPVRLDAERTARVTDQMVRDGAVGTLVTGAEARAVRKQYRKDAWYRLLHRVGLRPIGPKLRSGVFAAWKADLLGINGFDEEYRGWGNEDDNLGLRLHRAGIRGRNPFPEVLTVHLHHPPHRPAGERSNAAYHLARRKAIRGGVVRAAHGVESPLGGDTPRRTVLHDPARPGRGDPPGAQP